MTKFNGPKPSCDRMSDMEKLNTKRYKSGQERQAEYRKNNQDKIKLSKGQEKLKTMKKSLEDNIFCDEVKKKERERKAAYRAKQTSEKRENKKENEETVTMVEAMIPPNPKSRQSLTGLLARRRTSKEKSETIDDLVKKQQRTRI